MPKSIKFAIFFLLAGALGVSAQQTGRNYGSVLVNPMTTLGDLLYGGASGVATRLAGATAPAGVPEVLTSTPNSSGVAQASAWATGGVAIDSQSTTYTIQCSTSGSPNDRLGLVVFTGSSATTFTLPQAVSSATSCFGANFATRVRNEGTALLTITATTSVFEPSGSSSITLAAGQAVTIYSDNTNFHAVVEGGSADATFTNATTALSANTCSASAVTVTLYGARPNMAVVVSPTADVSGGTGWGSSGGLQIDAWISSNDTMSYKICNATSGSITPTAETWVANAR